jgi:hypothetical protein
MWIREACRSWRQNAHGLRREPMEVQDVKTGTEYSIAQNLGKDVV